LNDLVEYKPLAPMTADEVQNQVIVIKQIMQKIMIKDVHYGQIPGTKGNALWKPGSDTLLSAFHIAVDPEIEDLSTYNEIRYRIKCRGLAMGSGTLVGIGIGECSSNEEKYKWRKASEKEFNRTSNDQRRVKFGKVWNDNQRCMVEGEINQVRAEPADIANTVLKMAKKRAQVDLTLTALAAGDVFDQPSAPEPAMKMSDEPKSNPRHQRPDIPPGFDDAADAGADGELNLGFIRTAMASSGLRDVDLWAALEVSAWNEIKDDKLRKAAVWIEQNSP
jgi:hypothetical protein